MSLQESLKAKLLHILKWTAISIPVALLAGTASAGFLWTLEWVTDWRESHVWIIVALPVCGFFVGWLYHVGGKDVEPGNMLIVDEIHDPRKAIRFRMAPLVLLGTVLTHLFGGSAGREGTAVQMGGSLADQLSKPFRLNVDERRILLMAGMSAGFGSVFGTPLAGAIFGLEVLLLVQHRFRALVPCFVSAILADRVTRAFGIHHSAYRITEIPGFQWSIVWSVLVAGLAFGLVGAGFAKTTHAIAKIFKGQIRYAPFRPLIGGAIVALGVYVLGTTRYIGLGVPTILDAFQKPMMPWDFALKFIFTAVTLGASFKGGEVTPLFFIGATLGNILGPLTGASSSLFAGLGMVGVFAGAAATPFSSTVLAIELFGPKIGIYAGIACVVSSLFSGNQGIYHSPRFLMAKQGIGD